MREFFIIFILSNVLAECPPSEKLSPCKCYEIETIVVSEKGLGIDCIGSNITTNVLTKALGKTFNTNNENNTFQRLNIIETLVETIEKDTIGYALFNVISINNNPKLSRIHPLALNASSGHCNIIEIRNNAKLSGESLFELAQNMYYAKRMDFGYNNITSLPPRAFQPKNNHLIHYLHEILLNNNHIHSIGSYAFYNLQNLEFVNVMNNQLNQIDDNGFTFTEKTQFFRSWIYLENNTLTEKSLTKTSFQNPDHTYLFIFFEQNQLKSLPESVFKPLVGRYQIHTYGMNFTCDCSMEWMIHIPKANQSYFSSVMCQKQHKSIFQLKSHDLGNC